MMNKQLLEIQNADLLIYKQIEQIREKIADLEPIAEERKRRITQKLRLDWNFHSNAIEGNSLTYGETVTFLMYGLTAKGKPFRDYLDVKGHEEAIFFLLEMVKSGQDLSQRDVRELHKLLLKEPYPSRVVSPEGLESYKTIKVGEYKDQSNHVVTPTGKIHYYAEPHEVPIKIGELLDWYNEARKQPNASPLAIATIFHHQFVAIHPFGDGNGRMTRILMNLILMSFDFPPLVIRKEKRNDYILALSQADAGDIIPFAEFLGEQMYHSLEIYLKGAKGESIEEPDDVDKEIALLEKAINQTNKVEVVYSEAVEKKVLEESIIPLFKKLFVLKEKFGKLFADIEISDFIVEQNVKKGIRSSFFIKVPSLSILSRTLSFRSYRDINYNINLSAQFYFLFFEKKYSVMETLFLGKTLFEKKYHELITPQEIDYIYTQLSKIILDYIKQQLSSKT